jgi:hypothetical protein
MRKVTLFFTKDGCQSITPSSYMAQSDGALPPTTSLSLRLELELPFKGNDISHFKDRFDFFWVHILV